MNGKIWRKKKRSLLVKYLPFNKCACAIRSLSCAQTIKLNNSTMQIIETWGSMSTFRHPLGDTARGPASWVVYSKSALRFVKITSWEAVELL